MTILNRIVITSVELGLFAVGAVMWRIRSRGGTRLYPSRPESEPDGPAYTAEPEGSTSR